VLKGGLSRLGLAVSFATGIFRSGGRISNARVTARDFGGLQVLCAGKVHPHDRERKLLFNMKEILKDDVRVVFIPKEALEAATRVTAGVDLSLNTRAALNGIPSPGVLDGRWFEGHMQGVTSWCIGDRRANPPAAADPEHNTLSVYDKLEHVILPRFYNQRDRFIDVMRHATAINGSFSNTQRTLQQYAYYA
jgi:glycogen phosphorylase